MFVSLLLLAMNCNAEVVLSISKDLTLHPNWKLLDRGDNCGETSGGNRIIGGKEAALGQYPWMARLGYTNEEHTEFIFMCGGSIISSRYILTAGHCCCGFNKMTLVLVRVGEHFANEENDCDGNTCADPVQDFEVEEEICHDFDDQTLENDICLLRLKGSLKMNNFVSPICMPAYDFMLNTNFVNETVETSGWGIMDAATEESSNVLLTLKMPVVDHEKCSYEYALKLQRPLDERQMCAGGEVGKDSCGGDSGGPLMKIYSFDSGPRYFLLGVTSFGQDTCASTSLPGVYTVVHKYWEWILDNVKE